MYGEIRVELLLIFFFTGNRIVPYSCFKSDLSFSLVVGHLMLSVQGSCVIKLKGSPARNCLGSVEFDMTIFKYL